MKRVLLLAGFIFIFSSFSYAAKPAKSKKVPKGFVFIEGTTLKGGQKYKGPKNNYVFIEGRTIELKDFYICDHEVTYSEFYYDSGKYDKAEKNKPASFTWSRAIEYCNKRSIKEGLTPCYSGADNYVTCDFEADGYRLPTLADWIYAAMGGKEGVAVDEPVMYAGTNDSSELGDYAWYIDNCGWNPEREYSEYHPHDVKKKKPNLLGLYDMSGNLWEWCWDWYGAIDENTPFTGPERGTPIDKFNSTARVLAGGSYQNKDYDCCVTAQSWGQISANGIGVRLVRSKL